MIIWFNSLLIYFYYFIIDNLYVYLMYGDLISIILFVDKGYLKYKGYRILVL